jgi:GNAT superfamily N-acetyltransferase
LLVVGERGGETIATMQLTFIPGLSRRGTWRLQIEGVRVASTARGDGLGDELIRWAIDQARSRGCALVQLTSDARRQDAHRFYEHLGFVASHTGFKLAL